MASRRLARINEQLKREITELIRKEVRDPRIGVTTVTAVEASADLSVARVFVTIMGEDEEKGEGLEGLRAAAPFIRTELGRILRIRQVPELRFELDRSLEYAMRIERLLKEALPPEDQDSDNGDVDGAGEGPDDEAER